MIPFASQRALGQDLATHLLNEHDNDYMEVAELKGAVADDLHGAFAEWEAQAHALTKCENYIYSLSINPDPRQGELTRDQYFDYIDRAEDKLGLTGQPRAVVFHIKHGREHAHVVWSRIDCANEKAVQMSFDHDKLMMVTRLFAKEHGLQLPEGYDKDGKGAQTSLYEMHQQRTTGLSKEQHQEQVTEAWRASDSAKAFVRALSDRGYILATGNRPYVLVDLYGGMHALPRMIADKSVRTKDIRTFLEGAYPPESLPHVDDARAMAGQHLRAIEEHGRAEQRSDQARALEAMQERRRETLDADRAALKEKHQKEQQALAAQQHGQRRALRTDYLAETRRIKQLRQQNRPTGLAAFLGKVTGVNLLREKWQRHQDHKRLEHYLERETALEARQQEELRILARQQDMRALDMARKVRVLDQLEKRERRSFEETMRKEIRVAQRGGRDQMPSLGLKLTPRGRPAVPHKAMKRFTSKAARAQFAEQAKGEQKLSVDLTRDFAKASGGGEGGDRGDSAAETLAPGSEEKIRRYRRGRGKGRKSDIDRGR